jgi:ribosomal protein S18 acetylase RimI-like enzyme
VSGTPTCVVRGLTEDDWEVLRRIRLMALTDAPAAFETLLADAAAWSDQRWRERARGSATSRLFMAYRDDHPAGMAGIYAEDDGSAEVISVWVLPEQRRQGVARVLIAAAIEFAVGAGLSPVQIWVAEGNTAARRLYEALGFRVTGSHKPVRSQPSIEEHEMRLQRDPATVAEHRAG